MNTRMGLVLMALLLAATAFAQGFWQKKAPGAWTSRECEMLLTDSPWAKSRTIGDVLIEDLEKAGSIEGREGRPWITYTARFWSATPVRQAFVRQRQLSKDFHIPASGAEADRGRTERPHSQHGISLTGSSWRSIYATNVDSYRRDLARYWQTRPAAIWSMDTFLITGRGRIPPLDVQVVPGEGGQFATSFPPNGQWAAGRQPERQEHFPRVCPPGHRRAADRTHTFQLQGEGNDGGQRNRLLTTGTHIISLDTGKRLIRRNRLPYNGREVFTSIDSGSRLRRFVKGTGFNATMAAVPTSMAL